MKTVITTSGRPSYPTSLLAKEAANILGYEIVERNKQSIKSIQKINDSNCIVAGKDRFELYRIGMEKPFFFHPNSAAFRLKRLIKGETDPLIEATQLKSGMSFLDCTLGLASDSIIASYIVGELGNVTGVELDRDIAFITMKGLLSFPSKSNKLIDAMHGIHVVQDNAINYLKKQSDSSWDIVYIDPMFSDPINESSNFTPLRQVGAKNALTELWLEHALRVCKERVVIKDRFDSPVFEQFEFKRYNRPNTKFHFASLEK
ncbi:class I SAM-dependent methyltransferase [Sporosarcina sp. FA9]|uniref:class I SAM-dependent methyltransferase n=1 Tax=Sporosarcina sp. FA9 TaxID=3413030 RepID=UPI003F658619